MIKRIHCNTCGPMKSHPEDEADGISTRNRLITVKKPERHVRSVISREGAHTHIMEEQLPTLQCDLCGQPILDGQVAHAITIWERGETPTDWESEFGTVC